MKGKHFAKAYWSKTRIVSVILSIALLFGCITFTTAWLIAEDKDGVPVVNEFTGSQLTINLTPDNSQSGIKLIPGVTYTKENNPEITFPQVTVLGNSVDCYLFVEFYETGVSVNGEKIHLDSYVNYNFSPYFNKYFAFDNNDETPYKRYIGYHYDEATPDENYVASSSDPQSFDLTSNVFTIKNSVTKDEVNPAVITGENMPKITFKVYSIQTVGFKGTHTEPEYEKNEDGSIVYENGQPKVKYTQEQRDILAAWDEVARAIDEGNTKEVVLN